ncbi:MAG: flagellar hook assembly protein FlgD [bacterium]
MRIATDGGVVTAASEGTSTAIATQTANPNQNLGRDEFMRLLTAQLTHQDPLQPVTNEAFIAQLAQFSALEQMQGIRGALETSQILDQSMNNFLAASLIGRQVRSTGDTVGLTSGSPTEFYVGIARDAKVNVSIVSESGEVVRRLAIGNLPAGQNRILWDGKGEGGAALPSGRYRIEVAATDDTGASVSAGTGTIGEVTSLRFHEGRAFVVVDGREVPIDEVEEIRAGK